MESKKSEFNERVTIIDDYRIVEISNKSPFFFFSFHLSALSYFLSISPCFFSFLLSFPPSFLNALHTGL